MKERIIKILKNDSIYIFFINLSFFILFNTLFQIKYEQVDDFIIMNLISGSDGFYTIFGVCIHPFICAIIMLLFKTGININWYSIVLLVLQFCSFTIIGTVLIRKNKKIGIITYILFMLIYYSKMLMYIQYTSIAAMCIIAGVVSIIYFMDNMKQNKIFFIVGIISIIIGTMLRMNTIIITIPFLAIYVLYYVIKNKQYFYLKYFAIVMTGIILVITSYYIIYNSDGVYKEFLKFHDIRAYFHDFNYVTYEENENAFQKAGWSYNDREVFYTYAFGDEDVYNIDTLKTIKNNLNETENTNLLEKTKITINQFIDEVKTTYLLPMIFLAVITIFCVINCDNKVLFSLVFFLTIGVHLGFIFIERQMFRVVISGYIAGTCMMLYLIPMKNEKESKEYFYTKLAMTIFVMIFSIIVIKNTYKDAIWYDKEDFKVYREIIEYTSNNKENAYLYTVLLRDRFLAYSVYEKIPDNSFSNLRPLGDWDTYTQNYYEFKERYEIDNIMNALYEKDNVYLIFGKFRWGKVYNNYIDIIVEYIKEHYNVKVEYKVVKEFNENIRIYKLEEI